MTIGAGVGDVCSICPGIGVGVVFVSGAGVAGSDGDVVGTVGAAGAGGGVVVF